MRTGPNPELGQAILRVVLGVVFVSHGAHKLFASGVGPVAEFLGGLGFPLPGFFAWIVTILEFGGGLALIVGFMVTPLALLFILHMGLGIVTVHAAQGWFVLGPGQGGAEFNTVLITGLLALVLGGPGLAALDGRRREPAPEFGAGMREPASGERPGPAGDRPSGAAGDRSAGSGGGESSRPASRE